MNTGDGRAPGYQENIFSGSNSQTISEKRIDLLYGYFHKMPIKIANTTAGSSSKEITFLYKGNYHHQKRIQDLNTTVYYYATGSLQPYVEKVVDGNNNSYWKHVAY